MTPLYVYEKSWKITFAVKASPPQWPKIQNLVRKLSYFRVFLRLFSTTNLAIYSLYIWPSPIFILDLFMSYELSDVNKSDMNIGYDQISNLKPENESYIWLTSAYTAKIVLVFTNNLRMKLLILDHFWKGWGEY